ncbi:hypothetical protein EHS25_008130 [Saitozyma podzolica]|uniref:Major facilitator superfamily (MFS) profile domain-containing protein n=1 Tax=Saitozyma podzolica TaxID=1890683 RepID=A0A427YNM8_9TREE|nr:hypothetical protein EHS25_008130 [Saitozyma podzolica]
MTKPRFAPDRDEVPTLSSLGVTLHEDTIKYVYDPVALADSLGGNGIKDIFASWTVFVGAFAACMGGLLFGFDQGILAISLTMPQFLHTFPETDPSVTSSAGLNKGQLGAFLGALQAGYLADRFSRKMAIVIGSVWFIIGSTLQASAFSFSQLVVGRFIGGIGIGILSSTAPMYISEISPPNVRGALLVLESNLIVLGVIIMFYITYATRHMASDWAFRLPFTVQMAPCVVLAFTLWQLPYSPRWLALRGRDMEALESLSRLRSLPKEDPRVQAEWITVRAEAIHNREVLVAAHPSLQGMDWRSELKLEAASWADMFRPKLIRQTMIGIMLMFFQQFVGINALVYYSPTLFQQLGLDYELQLTLSGVLNIAQFTAIAIAFLILDKVGRRPPLLWGAVGMAASHFIVAAMIATYEDDWASHPTQAWVGVGFIFGFMMCYGIGWGPVPWTMPAEVLNSSRRAKGVALATCSNWFNNFIIGLVTPPMIQGARYGTFIFFGSFATLAGVWTWFFVPETKGRTLEQMDEVFHGHVAHEELAAKRQIMEIVCGEALQRGSAEYEGKGETEMVEAM